MINQCIKLFMISLNKFYSHNVQPLTYNMKSNYVERLYGFIDNLCDKLKCGLCTHKTDCPKDHV